MNRPVSMIRRGRGPARQALVALALGAGLALSCQGVIAQTWPVRPVRLILPAPPGGGTDAVARTLAQKLSDGFGQAFIVENKPGGNGVVGAAQVAKAPPDGYQLMISASVHLINALIMKQVPYDAVADFTPITQIAEVPELVVVHPSQPINDIRELALRRDAAGLNWAIAAVGSPDHLIAESLKTQVDAPLTIVPYKGLGPAISDTLGGQVAGMAAPVLSLIAHVRDGRLRPLAVSTTKRNVGLPNVPTLAETVMPGYVMTSWYGLWGPKGMSASLAAQIAAVVRKGFMEPDIRTRFPPESFEVIGSSPDEFSRLIASEVTRYTKIVQAARISIE
jgi:tripartite-type tricarboxylate transporter receptor subunit TctC